MHKSVPLEVFYSYAHEDEALRDELEKHLKLLQRQGLISNWHDRRIEPGRDWAAEIDSHSGSADIFLLLVSADFISSDYCYGVEMMEALERHRRHEAIVIPIILRPVNWDTAPFAGIQALPRNGKPITTWPNRDEAFADVSRGIRAVVLHYGPVGAVAVGGDIFRTQPSVPRDRVLDAAIPSHVVKDQSTELLAKIRLPGSPGLVGTLSDDEEAEASPEDVRSTEFDVVFPIEPDGRPGDLRVEITLTSPDFRPSTQTKVMFVPPEDDSDTCYFLLTPVRTGHLRVLIELRWEEAVRGSRRLRTECVATAENIPARTGMSVVQMKLGAGLERSEVNPQPPAASAAARRGWLTPAIVIAIIGAISSVTVGYLQFGPKPKLETVTGSAVSKLAPSVIAGRVIDSENMSAISHAVVSLSGRPESALTDDLGNYRILVTPAVANQIFRLQVEKAGCTPVDRNVRPPEENLVLELSCRVKSPQPQPQPQAANVAQKARDEANRGWWYETGQIGQIDGRPDYQAAMRWYLKAVDDGDVIANWNVGRLYEFGFGVPIDLDKAKAWYQKGADKGDMNAQDYLVNLGHNRKY